VPAKLAAYFFQRRLRPLIALALRQILSDKILAWQFDLFHRFPWLASLFP
jgi:hypothetical protein